MIDEHVDQLASAAAGALGSFWSGLGGAINNGLTAAGLMATQIEQAAQRPAFTDPPPGPYGCVHGSLAQVCRVKGGANVAHPACHSLALISRTQLSRLGYTRLASSCRVQRGSNAQGVDGTLVLNGNSHGGHADDWQVVDLLGSPASSVTMSFEQLFKLYRGPRFTDELETLSGSAAKSCNRLRSQMSGALHVVVRASGCQPHCAGLHIAWGKTLLNLTLVSCSPTECVYVYVQQQSGRSSTEVLLPWRHQWTFWQPPHLARQRATSCAVSLWMLQLCHHRAVARRTVQVHVARWWVCASQRWRARPRWATL